MSTQSTSEVFFQLPILSTPRPNGSRALKGAVEGVEKWLESEGVTVAAHEFALRPYFMELLGLWLAVVGLLLPVAALNSWGWMGLVLALLAVAVPLLEVRFLCPTVTALVRQRARNLVVRFPVPRPRHEVILCAHLDSKTELLDHAQREVLLRQSLPAMGLALVAGASMAAERLLATGTASQVIHWLAFLAALPVAVYGLGMGANQVGGRFSRQPSSGAVDNGAAVAVLLDLARRLHRGSLGLDHTAVTLLFTVGEEAQMQGALAYVQCSYGPSREDWSLPTCAVNMEVVGQDGGYLLWEEDGTAMQRLPADATLKRALGRAVEAVSGEPPVRSPTINSDAFAFLRRGIPAATLGSLDSQLGERGFHSSLDAPGRVDPDRLAETTRVLGHLLAEMDRTAAQTSAG
jgi:hypothetical protein